MENIRNIVGFIADIITILGVAVGCSASLLHFFKKKKQSAVNNSSIDKNLHSYNHYINIILSNIIIILVFSTSWWAARKIIRLKIVKSFLIIPKQIYPCSLNDLYYLKEHGVINHYIAFALAFFIFISIASCCYLFINRINEGKGLASWPDIILEITIEPLIWGLFTTGCFFSAHMIIHFIFVTINNVFFESNINYRGSFSEYIYITYPITWCLVLFYLYVTYFPEIKSALKKHTNKIVSK